MKKGIDSTTIIVDEIFEIFSSCFVWLKSAMGSAMRSSLNEKIKLIWNILRRKTGEVVQETYHEDLKSGEIWETPWFY